MSPSLPAYLLLAVRVKLSILQAAGRERLGVEQVFCLCEGIIHVICHDCLNPVAAICHCCIRFNDFRGQN